MSDTNTKTEERSPSRSPSHGRHRRKSSSRSPSRGRGRRRKSSVTRSGSRSYDSESDFSDSFYTDDDSTVSRRRRGDRRGHAKPMGPKSRARAGANNRNAPRGPVSPRALDYVTKRMLSARRIKINELHSEVDDLKNQLLEAKKENKTLTRQQRIQERQLDRYEGQENEMPAVLQRHAQEVHALREQQRRQKERYQKTSKKLRDNDEELERTRRLLKKMRGLVDDKQLKERDDLTHTVDKQEAELDERARKIASLERHIENLNKNHRHEIGIERARHKETAAQLHEARDENQKLQATLREKEKELEISNIYHHRVMRPPHKLNSSVISVSSSPFPDTGRPRRSRRRSSSPVMQTPRDRAKQFEEERKDKMKKKKEEKERKKLERDAEKEMASQAKEREARELLERLEEEKREREENERKRHEEERIQLEEDRKWQEERERQRRVAEEMLTRQQQEQEEQARKQREELERLERERQEREERERRQQEEIRRRAQEEERLREEAERRAEEERRRLLNDQAEQEKRLKKELLLARMKAIDEGNNKSAVDNNPFVPQGATKKDYNHSEPIQNMHRGKPAYNNVTVPVLEKTKKKNSLFDSDNDSDENVGYQPTFSGKSKPRQNGFLADNSAKGKTQKPPPQKKSNLMEDLFGSTATDSAKRNRTATREGSSTALFGGGNAILDEEEAPPASNSHLLPRRTRQTHTTTLASKPTINAVDNLDDDIEEVVL